MSAGLLGGGFGVYLAVDLALITEVLPSAEDSGRDLGIINIALTLPQTFAPALSALFITQLGGYAQLFGTAAAGDLDQCGAGEPHQRSALMRDSFPDGFLWGAATAAHQVQGDNRNSDWWEWETATSSKVPLAEPSGIACNHLHRYREDIALLAGLGLNAYRFSVEWARVEPRAGEFDQDALAHYADVVAACVQSGVTPIVTLQHFTLPAWVTHAGSWLNPDMTDYAARYTRKVGERLGDRAPYFCTINEPGNLVTRGYLGTFPTPPFIQDLTAFDRAAATVNAAHRRSRDVINELFPSARVGMAHALQDWRANPGGMALMTFARELYEDRFFAETGQDDFIGVQTYTRVEVDVPELLRPLAAVMLGSRRLTEAVLLPLLRRSARATEPAEGQRSPQSTALRRAQSVARSNSAAAA